jgi:cytochrome bd-type quinol oxidase subunit 1
MFLRAGAIWILVLIIAVANGAIREAVITPPFGEQVAHIVSTAILCAAIFVVAWFSIWWIRPNNRHQALLIGIQWVMLTIAFEFLAGHYVFGNTWERLLADYNVSRGRIWVLVLFASLFASLWAFRRTRPA